MSRNVRHSRGNRTDTLPQPRGTPPGSSGSDSAAAKKPPERLTQSHLSLKSSAATVSWRATSSATVGRLPSPPCHHPPHAQTLDLTKPFSVKPFFLVLAVDLPMEDCDELHADSHSACRADGAIYGNRYLIGGRGGMVFA